MHDELMLNELLAPKTLLRELHELVFADVVDDNVRYALRGLRDAYMARVVEGDWTNDMQDDREIYREALERSLEARRMKPDDVPEIRRLERITDRVMLLGMTPEMQLWLYRQLTTPKRPVIEHMRL